MITDINPQSSLVTTNRTTDIIPTNKLNRRILVIDDDQSILATYRSILQPQAAASESLFNLLGENQAGVRESFEVVTATQGQLGVECVRTALAQNSPFSVVFVDMRMPPGWDGLRTAQALRALDPNLYIVVASAYADYTADQIQAALTRDAVLLRKPFGRDEVYQLARTLAHGWSNRRVLQDLNYFLSARVAEHAAELKRYLALERMIAEVSARCSVMRDESVTQNLSWILEWLGQVMNAEHCFIASCAKSSQDPIKIHQYHVNNLNASDIKTLITPFINQLNSGAMITNAPTVANNLLIVALNLKEQNYGFLGCEVLSYQRNWSIEDINLFTTIACIIGRVFD